MRVVLFGGSGQFGTTFQEVAAARGFEVVAPTHEECDVTRPIDIRPRVDAIVNAAALRDLATCEDNPGEALAVNALGARHVADAAQGRRSVYVSSDYVFAGPGAYGTADRVSPAQVYGVTKAAGEHFTLAAGGAVVRTAALFGQGFPNFIEKMLENEEPPRVVDDQFTSPTSCKDLAWAILDLLTGRTAPRGVYHAVGTGNAPSWYAFATFVRLAAGLPLPRARATRASEIRRPLNASLEPSPELRMRTWSEMVTEYLAERR